MNYQEHQNIYKFEDVIRVIALKLIDCSGKSVIKDPSFDAFENLITARATDLSKKYKPVLLDRVRLEEEYIEEYRKNHPEPLRTERLLVDYVVKYIEEEIKKNGV